MVVQTYFGMGQQCLVGLVGRQIQQKAERGEDVGEAECDAYGGNLVKATLPRAGWALHHDAINLQVHRTTRQLGMVNSMEVGNFFMRMLSESAIIPDHSMPLLSKHLKG